VWLNWNYLFTWLHPILSHALLELVYMYTILVCAQLKLFSLLSLSQYFNENIQLCLHSSQIDFETGCSLISHFHTFSAQGILAPPTSWFHCFIPFVDHSWSGSLVYKGLAFHQKTVQYWFFSWLWMSPLVLTMISSSAHAHFFRIFWFAKEI